MKEWSTLRKLIWLRMAAFAKGVWSTISGIAPLLLPNAIAKGIKSLIQTGKCEQTATPSPSSPADISCNNGTFVAVDDELPNGYKRVLGFSLNADCYWQIPGLKLNGADTVRASISVDAACNIFGCYTDTSAQNNYSLYVSTTSGAKYLRYNGGTYKSYWASGNLGDRFDIVISPTGSSGMPSGQNDSWTASEFIGTVDMCIGTTSPSASSSKMKGRIYGPFVVDNRFNGIPCERVSDNTLGYYDTYTETFYEPSVGAPTSLGYDGSHYGLAVAGTSEVITVCGKNLFDISEHTIEQGDIASADGVDTGAAASRVRCVGYIHVKPSTVYTVSCQISGTSTPSFFVVMYPNASTDGYTDKTIGWKESGTSFTTDATTNYLRLVFAMATTGSDTIMPGDVEWVQIEAGDTATAYEPYHEQTATASFLLSAGTCQDTQDIISGEIHRKCGIATLTGEESVTITNSCFVIPISDKIKQKTNVLCSHFPYSSETSTQTDDETIISFSSVNVGFRYDACADTTAFSTWLAGQYAVGTPVIVIYPLDEESEESAEPQPLQLSAGDNTIDIVASVNGIELAAEYMRKS